MPSADGIAQYSSRYVRNPELGSKPSADSRCSIQVHVRCDASHPCNSACAMLQCVDALAHRYSAQWHASVIRVCTFPLSEYSHEHRYSRQVHYISGTSLVCSMPSADGIVQNSSLYVCNPELGSKPSADFRCSRYVHVRRRFIPAATRNIRVCDA